MAFAKKCKYCDLVMIVWNDIEGKYYEKDSTEQHTKERCQEAQAKAGTHSTQQTKTQGYFKTGQDQKSEDIKTAQKERREQHRELIKNLQWNTKMLARTASLNGGVSAESILNDIGFEEYREDQSSFQDEVV
jgi:hypothetical protein